MNAFDILAICQRYEEADRRCLAHRGDTALWKQAHKDLMQASDDILAAVRQFNREQRGEQE